MNVAISFFSMCWCLSVPMAMQSVICNVILWGFLSNPSIMKLGALASRWGVPRSYVKILPLFSRLCPVQIRATRRLKYSHKFHNSQSLNSFQIEMHEAAIWVGCRVSGLTFAGPGSWGTRYDEEIQSDKARWGSDINTWQHCVAHSKCVIPTKATQSHNATWFPN